MVENNVDTPVLIVGAGPAGLALALDLAQRGQRSVVVEEGPREPELLFKAGGLNERTLEFCRRWGIAADVAYWGAPDDYPRDTTFCVSLTGPLIGRDPLPSAREWPVRSSSPEKWRKCPQYVFDPILARAALRTGMVDIRYDSSFVDFTQDADGVTSTIRPEDGAPYQVRSRYLAGCDGAGSVVRQKLGVMFTGIEQMDYSVSIMLKIEKFERYHDMGRVERVMFVDKDGTWANLTSVDMKDYWRMTLVGSEERLDPAKIDVPAVLKRAFGDAKVPYEVIRVVPWRRAQFLAESYGQGRVFLAGDAVHTTSPTGGHGINTGLGDVVGLGWMLDAALRGWAGPKLLDAYTVERRPVAFRNFSSSTRNYRNWVSGPDFSKVEDTGPEGDDARAQIAEHFIRKLYPEWHSYGVAMGYRYEDSPIIVPDGTAPTHDDPSMYPQTARPGHRAPHAWVEPGRSTIDLFGHGFVLLRFDPALDVTPLQQAAARVGMPLTVHTLVRPEIAALYERKLCLVRPDGHSAWRDDTLPQNVDNLVDRVRGAL